MPEQVLDRSSLVAAQLDSFQTSLTAVVKSCNRTVDGRFAARLSDTVLYPEGGGQPADLGSIYDSVLQREVPVVDVQRVGGEVLHYIADKVGEGSSVEVRTDWDRRFDHMQIHTGQHLLSAVVDEVVGVDTISWEMHPFREGTEPSANTACIDLPVAGITAKQIQVQHEMYLDKSMCGLKFRLLGQPTGIAFLQAVEARCNSIIRSARAVTSHVVHEADQSPLLSSSVFRGQVPSWDTVQGDLRLVEIDSIDINACGGTHLRTTAQIQLIKIVGTERAHGGTRITFLAGGRAIQALQSSLTREAGLNKVLGCGVQEHESTLTRLQVDRKQLAKANKALLDELASAAGHSLAAELPPKGGFACYHRKGADAAFLNTMASAIEATQPRALVLLTASTAGSTHGASKPHAGCFLLVGPAEHVKALGQQAADAMEGKGGGRGTRYQGKSPRIDLANKAQEVLRAGFAAYA